MDKKLLIFLITAVLLVILMTGGYFYWKSLKIEQASLSPAQTVAETVTESAGKGTLPAINTTANPYEKTAETNPLEKANPFENVKTNPFK